jgi:hypothetical protein
MECEGTVVSFPGHQPYWECGGEPDLRSVIAWSQIDIDSKDINVLDHFR